MSFLRLREHCWPLTIGRLLAVLCAVGALWAQAAGAEGSKAVWGELEMPDGTSAFPIYRDLGVDVYQAQLVWSRVAKARPVNPRDPADPAYAWPATVDFAIAEGGKGVPAIEVALMVKGTPAWAGEGAAADPSQPPADERDYADFLVAAAKRYPAVDRWMIWGETNRSAVFRGTAVDYAELLDAAYGALKPLGSLSDPEIVVGGMTFTYGETAPAMWIDAMKLRSGGRPRFDEYGHNPFSRRCPDLSQGPDYLQIGGRDISDIDTLREEIRTAFGSYKPLWLSEYTVSSDRPNRAFGFFVDRFAQADWLARAYKIAGHVPGVSGLGWFALRDEDAANGLTTGLLDSALVPKPAYVAYKAASMTDEGLPGPCPGTAAPPSPLFTPPPVRADREPPKVALVAKSAVRLKDLRGGLPFKVSCNEACRITGRLLIDRKTARRIGMSRRSGSAVEIGRASKVLRSRGSATLKIKISRRLKAKFRLVRRATLTLRLSVSDAAGSVTRKTKTIRLRR